MEEKDCIFCKIISGVVPTHKVYEDENFLGILDIKPLGPGHTQIIPKKHYRWVWDVPNAGEMFEVVKKIALAQKRAFGVDTVRAQIYGEEVPHAHIWVWPESGGNESKFEQNAEKLISALK